MLPQVNKCSEKVVFEKMFPEWPNCRKTKIQDSSLAYSQLASLVSATLGHYYSHITAESLNFCLIKLVKKKQCFILRISTLRFTAKLFYYLVAVLIINIHTSRAWSFYLIKHHILIRSVIIRYNDTACDVLSNNL